MVALGSADDAQSLGLGLLGGGHDEAVALSVDSDRLLKERVDTLLGGILEMGGTEHGRCSDHDHIHTRVDDLLVGVETDEAVLIGNNLVPLLLQLVFQAVEPVGEGVSKSGDGDSVSSVEKVHDSTGTAAAAADHTSLERLAVDSLVRKLGNVVLIRLPKGNVNGALVFLRT